MKLEGARAGNFQTIMIIGIEDPEVLAHLNEFTTRCKNPDRIGSGPLLATRPRSSTCRCGSTAGTGLRGAPCPRIRRRRATSV